MELYDSTTKGQMPAPSATTNPETADRWHRVSTPGEGDWKFSHRQDRSDEPLDDSLAAAMVAAIDEGVTVGGLKAIIAKHSAIQDANRVILVAQDGLRRGSLDGNHWQVRQVRTWLCRSLAVEVTPGSGYVVSRGLRREFVYYPAARESGEPKVLDTALDHFRTRVRQGSHFDNKSELDCPGEIPVRLNGKHLEPSRETVEWGASYDFELPDDFAEAFSLEESWLLGATEACSTCVEDKKLSEMPIRITSRCQHLPTVCKDCLERWLKAGIERGVWDRLRCPDCRELLEWEDVRRCASKGTFERYDNLLFRRILAAHPTFQFCLPPDCDSGQMYERKCPRFDCVDCGKSYCIKHRVLWHSGETCQEYEERSQVRTMAYEASEEFIRTATRTCPNCKKPVLKEIGCNHITCVCGHEWCYLCQSPYSYSKITGLLRCQHQPGCAEHDVYDEAYRRIHGEGRQEHLRAAGDRPLRNALRDAFWADSGPGLTFRPLARRRDPPQQQPPPPAAPPQRRQPPAPAPYPTLYTTPYPPSLRDPQPSQNGVPGAANNTVHPDPLISDAIQHHNPPRLPRTHRTVATEIAPGPRPEDPTAADRDETVLGAAPERRMIRATVSPPSSPPFPPPSLPPLRPPPPPRQPWGSPARERRAAGGAVSPPAGAGEEEEALAGVSVDARPGGRRHTEEARGIRRLEVGMSGREVLAALGYEVDWVYERGDEEGRMERGGGGDREGEDGGNG